MGWDQTHPHSYISGSTSFHGSVFGASQNDTYPELIIHSIPVPDFIGQTEHADIALSMLTESVKKLDAFHPRAYAIACNTAHLLLPSLQKQTKTPFVDVPKLVSEQLSSYKTVGLLASPTTLQSGLYTNLLHEASIDVVMPTAGEIERIEQCIQDLVGGKKNGARRQLVTIARGLASRGAQALVLGCTELSLVFPKKFDIPIVDSLEVLAHRIISMYHGKDIV